MSHGVAPSKSRYWVHVWPWLRPIGGLLLPNWLAISLGSHIFAWRRLSPRELAHEQEHVRQWLRHGRRFPIHYLAASLQAWRAGRGWYRGNRFEREALAAEERVRETA